MYLIFWTSAWEDDIMFRRGKGPWREWKKNYMKMRKRKNLIKGKPHGKMDNDDTKSMKQCLRNGKKRPNQD